MRANPNEQRRPTIRLIFARMSLAIPMPFGSAHSNYHRLREAQTNCSSETIWLQTHQATLNLKPDSRRWTRSTEPAPQNSTTMEPSKSSSHIISATKPYSKHANGDFFSSLLDTQSSPLREEGAILPSCYGGGGYMNLPFNSSDASPSVDGGMSSIPERSTANFSGTRELDV